MSYIKVKNLTYKYSNEKNNVLKDINMEINKGEIVLIVGNIASGKSTLLKALSGAVPHFYGGEIEGNIFFNDKNIEEMTQKDRAEEVSCVFQYPELQMIMDEVHREIAFSLENLGVSQDKIKRRVFEALHFLGLQKLAYRKIEELSGGEKQKVVLAGALAQNTEIMLLDEPTSQLDPKSSSDVISLCKKINEELFKTIIVVEQRIDGWFDIADKIIYLEDGHIDSITTKEGFYKSSHTDFLPTYLKIAKNINYIDKEINFKSVRRYIYESEKNEISEESIVDSVDTVLSLKNVNVSYDKSSILKDINVDFHKGKISGIIGENGSGKTTLLKSIMHLIKYDGKILLNGENISKKKTYDIAKHIGYVSQNPNDYISKETVYDEVKFTCDNYKINYEEIEYILKKLNLYEFKDKNPRDLSGGQKQRLALATILVTKPDILLLDEPTRGLDYKGKTELSKILKDMVSQNKTVIMVTHDMDFLSEYSDEIVLILNGEIIQKGNSRDVLREGMYYTSTAHKLSGRKEIITKEDIEKWIN